MVLSCVVIGFAQAHRIKRALYPLAVFEETISNNETAISVRLQSPEEADRVRALLMSMGVEEISEFSEAA